MKQIDVASVTKDVAARFAFLAEFVGFTQTDWDALQESLPILAPKLPLILDALYDHLLSYDDTRRVFLGTDGELDPTYIEIRKEHLTEWVLKTIGAAENPAAFARYLYSVGLRHTGTAGDTHRVVPPRYIVALTSFVQTALVTTTFAEVPDDLPKALRIALAWNKMMVLQLEIFLKAIVPHTPDWDEPMKSSSKTPANAAKR